MQANEERVTGLPFAAKMEIEDRLLEHLHVFRGRDEGVSVYRSRFPTSPIMFGTLFAHWMC
jgi:hypothetical protein